VGVFSRHWKNMTRAFVREVDCEIVALVLSASDATVLRSFEASDGALFGVAPVVLH
jgi:hypothetical protein